MVDYQTLSIILTGVSMAIALTYYAIQIRNQNKTRQAQLYMQIHSKWSDREFIRGFYNALNEYEFNDAEDFFAKYGQGVNEDAFVTINEITRYFEGVGQLLRDGLIDFRLVKSLYSYRIIDLWEKYYPLVVYLRESAFGHPNPEFYENFEYLYNELVKYRDLKQQNP